MGERTEFIAFCLEEYKAAKNLNGKNVIKLFNKYKLIEYIGYCYEALHTQGPDAIIWDIDNFIKSKRVKRATHPLKPRP
jgi:hypothetical protein